MDSLLNTAPCGFVSFQDNGVLVRVNATLAAWLNYDPDKLVGRKVEDIFTLATRIFYNTHLFPMVKLHHKADEIYLTLIGRDKQELPVLANAQRIQEGDGYVINCIFLPVFQRKQYEEEILNAKHEAETALRENKHLQELRVSLEKHMQEVDRQYQKILDMNRNLLQFSKIISHDLQEPLHKIRLYTNMMLSGPKDSWKDAETRLSKILDHADRLSTLITGLRQYVAVDTDKVHSHVNLNTTIELAKASAVSARKFEGFDLTHEQLPVLEGYPAQLELLFYHLIDNSIKFREPSRKLQIQISGVILDENQYRFNREKYNYTPHLRLTFSDNGTGFDNEYHHYVFELLKKMSQDSGGLGIGLALVKKIVDNHAGTIKVHSEKGKGTTFTLYLPMKVA